MCKSDGLGFLEVCKTGHVGLKVFTHYSVDDFKKIENNDINLSNLFPDVELHIKSYLIISAPSCVKLLSGVSNPCDKICFYKAVDVFSGISFMIRLRARSAAQSTLTSGFSPNFLKAAMPTRCVRGSQC